MKVVQEKVGRAFRSGYARDITLALVIKLALLAALVALFSRAASHPASDASATAAAVAGLARAGGSSP